MHELHFDLADKHIHSIYSIFIYYSFHFVEGLAGFFPITPQTYMKAWRCRKEEAERLANEAQETKEATS